MATLLALGSLALGAYETWQGYENEQEAKQQIAEANKNRADYAIPTSIQEQLNLLRLRSTQGLPGEQAIQGQIEQGVAQGVSKARETATTAADLLGATTNLYGQRTQALTNLSIESARQRAANEMAYAQGLNTKAQYEDKAFTWNEAIPWQVSQNIAQNQLQSAYDMKMSGINSMMYAGSSLYGNANLNNNVNNNQQVVQQPYTSLQYNPQGIYWQDQSKTYGEMQGTPITLNQNSNNFNWTNPIGY